VKWPIRPGFAGWAKFFSQPYPYRGLRLRRTIGRHSDAVIRALLVLEELQARLHA
jgi:hypothetical protein